MELTGLDELREDLASSGWVIQYQPPSMFNECNWYAWTRDRSDITPDCALNDKPPSLVIYPNDGRIGDHRLDSLEVEITGEVYGGEWLKLRAYNIKSGEFKERFPSIRARLAAAWKAGAGLNI